MQGSVVGCSRASECGASAVNSHSGVIQNVDVGPLTGMGNGDEDGEYEQAED